MTTRHALVCAPLMPEFDRESGSRRIFDLINFLREADWDVSFVAREASDGERYKKVLQQRGVPTYVGFTPRVEQLIGAAPPDLAILAFWGLAEVQLPLIRKLSPLTRILVDSIDLHFLRNARGTYQGNGPGRTSRLLDERFASDLMRELNVYAAADGVLTVSQKEADFLQDFLGATTPIYAVPDAEDMPGSTLPFEERKGILFIGNFRHAPNVSAVEYLCNEIVPLLDPALLTEHPVWIVGNDLGEKVRNYGKHLNHVQMVGWVPSVLPYLHRARATVIPLRYGAGTKRKLIQALMVGTPTVSTTVGVEGLPVSDGEHVLVADDPVAFARAIRRLLEDREFWLRLSSRGRAQIRASHGRGAAQASLLHTVAQVLRLEVKAPITWPRSEGQTGPEACAEVIQGVRAAGRRTLPPAANVLVASGGDEKLLQLGGVRAGHFPQTEGGVYAGHQPGDSGETIGHLEALRAKGYGFLLFPSNAFWWLEHDREFTAHLDARYRRICEEEHCIIYRLVPGGEDVGRNGKAVLPAASALELLRPRVPDLPALHPSSRRDVSQQVSPKSILVLGVYLAAKPNNAHDIIRTLAATEKHHVTQRWVALGGKPPTERVAEVTVRTVLDKLPKFAIINDLLEHEDFRLHDYVVLTDDDIVLPDRFLDYFITLQAQLDFRIAQPARTSNSYIDHPIVEQQRGVLARQTLFVEIGPLVSFHASCFDLVFPFDLTSPMGWGYENVWSFLLAQRGMKMGIIDAVPVDHSLRKPVSHYTWGEADNQRTALLKKHPHHSYDTCFRVLAAISAAEEDTANA